MTSTAYILRKNVEQYLSGGTRPWRFFYRQGFWLERGDPSVKIRSLPRIFALRGTSETYSWCWRETKVVSLTVFVCFISIWVLIMYEVVFISSDLCCSPCLKTPTVQRVYSVFGSDSIFRSITVDLVLFVWLVKKIKEFIPFYSRFEADAGSVIFRILTPENLESSYTLIRQQACKKETVL